MTTRHPERVASASKPLMKAVHAHERALLDVLEPALRGLPGVTVHSNAAKRTPTLLFTVEGEDPQEIRGLLAERD